MSGGTDKQSSTEVAQTAEGVRADLAHTLDQLRQNLKPEHVIEEVVSNARIGAHSLADGFYELARKNPIPALLIGAGCAMVLGFGSKAAIRGKSTLDLSPAGEFESDRVRSSLGRVRKLAAASRGAANADGVLRRQDSAGLWSPYRQVGSPQWVGRADDEASFTKEDTMDRSTAGFKRTTGEATSRLVGILHEQPLIIAALGIAVGAAIGASLPTTDIEDEWMGETSSTVKHAAKEAAQHEIDELKAVASRTADNLKQSAVDHGFSGDNISDLVKDAGGHAKSALHDVVATADGAKPA